MESSKYPLKDVHQSIRDNRYWFSAPSRSIVQVIAVFESCNMPCTESQATAFILAGILSLQDGDFVRRAIQWGDPKCVADIYGKVIEGHSWYIKFMLDDEGELEEISFHPPESNLITVLNVTIPGRI